MLTDSISVTANVCNSEISTKENIFSLYLVLAICIFAALTIYYKREQIKLFIFPVIIKFLLKMKREKLVYHIWVKLAESDKESDYEQFTKSYNAILNDPNTSSDLKNKATKTYQNAVNKRKAKDIRELLAKIEEHLKDNKFLDVDVLITDAKEKISVFVGIGKNDFVDNLSKLEKTKKEKVKELLISEIKDNILNNEYGSAFDKLRDNTLDRKELSTIIAVVKSIVCDNVNDLIADNNILQAARLVCKLKQYDFFKGQDFLESLEGKLISTIMQRIDSQISDYNYSRASEIRDEFCDYLPNSQILIINRRIKDCENSIPAQIKKLSNEALGFARCEKFKEAWSKYNAVKHLNGGDIKTLQLEIDKLQEEAKTRQNKELLKTAIVEIRKEINNEDFEKAHKLIVDAESIPVEDKTELGPIKLLFNEKIEACEKEKNFCGDFQIITPLYYGKNFFNIPKKIEKGEDADPYVNTSSKNSWGILSVFDGMGGAGARKYTHSITQEEHSSAWWASRFVKQAIEELISSRPKGVNPINYIELNLKKIITDKLDREILNFPAANAPLLSKMMRKLPTTLAMVVYHIVEDKVQINSFWAGDSRIYLIDSDKLHFLTIDDADAPDGDPFSPANMDLAMNNTICQDREFRINKTSITIPYSPDKPFVLVACTDGCFGYYKNPIEFEYMLRSTLSKSNNFDDWMPLIKKAIIDNIQQDDFSMSIVEIGTKSFSEFYNKFTDSLNDELFKDYITWKNQVVKEQEDYLFEIARLDEQIVELKNINSVLTSNIKKIKDDTLSSLKSINFDVEDIISLVNNKIIAMNDKISKNEDDIKELAAKRNSNKVKLEKLQIEADETNNEWYFSYKNKFAIIESKSEIN